MIRAKDSVLYVNGVLVGKVSFDSADENSTDFTPNLGSGSGTLEISVASEYTQEKLDQMLNRSILGWEI